MTERVAIPYDERPGEMSGIDQPEDESRATRTPDRDGEVPWNEHEGTLEWGSGPD